MRIVKIGEMTIDVDRIIIFQRDKDNETYQIDMGHGMQVVEGTAAMHVLYDWYVTAVVQQNLDRQLVEYIAKKQGDGF